MRKYQADAWACFSAFSFGLHIAAQQQVPTSARITNSAPNTVRAILAHETGSQAKTITKAAKTALQQHLDISGFPSILQSSNWPFFT
jgi:hypothetical protein